MAWLAPDRRLEALDSTPPECLVPAGSAEEAGLIAIGRTAFRNPSLLGGQAAMAGLSCETCHANGRRNEAFHFPGLSGDPGSADVTSSMMSSHRGNDLFDPRPIPDLAVPAKVSRNPAGTGLSTFVHGLITQEFDGAEPPPLAFRGVLTYIRALRICPSEARVPVTLAGAISDFATAVDAARIAFAAGDRPTTRLMLGGARNVLGQIDERYALPAMGGLRNNIRKVDHALLLLQQEVEAADPQAQSDLARVRLGSKLETALRKAEGRSLYAPDRLQALLLADK